MAPHSLGHARSSFTVDTYQYPVSELERRAGDTIDTLLRGGKKVAK